MTGIRKIEGSRILKQVAPPVAYERGNLLALKVLVTVGFSSIPSLSGRGIYETGLEQILKAQLFTEAGGLGSCIYFSTLKDYLISTKAHCGFMKHFL